MIRLKQHTNTALGYFLIVGLLGALLRLFFVIPISANFRFIVHAHSHVALLGWVYIGLTSLIYKMYFTKSNLGKIYKRIFWFTQISIIGMFVTFPFTGYALFSIIFSTLFLFASYFMAWFILKKTPLPYKATYSFRLIRAALWYMVLSSLGPWAVGAVMASMGNDNIWYKLAIYFYLHFQYNAWFILALCGILFYFIEKQNLRFQKRHFQSFFWQFHAAAILSFFLSTLWFEPHWSFYILGACGAVLQVTAFIQLFRLLKPLWKQFKISVYLKSLLHIAGVLLIGKIILQLISAVPFFAELVFKFPDFVIGYLHLVFLGVVSIALFSFLAHSGLLHLPKSIFGLFFSAFIVTELLIFYKGAALWLHWPLFASYYRILAGASFLLPLSIGLLLLNNSITNTKIFTKKS